MKKLMLIVGLDMANALAAGGGGSVSDLKWPWINFLILATVIVWKIKKPLAEMFEKNCSDVEYLYSVAEKRDKESKIRYEMYKKKYEGIAREQEAILETFHRKGADFVSEYKREGDAFIEKLKKEKVRRVEVEKKKMLRTMERALMDDVVFKVKKKIQEEKSLKNQVTRGLLSKIG